MRELRRSRPGLTRCLIRRVPRVLPRHGIPSGGWSIDQRRRTRLLALLAVRDGAEHLPGFLANVSPHVDGIVALDDASADGSAELLAAADAVVEVLHAPAGRDRWDEVANYRRLVAAGIAHGADWLLSIDVDERVERQFRPRAERVIRRGRPLGISAYSLVLHELWDGPQTFRADGIWGRKAVARLFRARDDHLFDTSPVHGFKAPVQARWRGRYPLADLRLYHLATVEADARRARRARYEALDPERRWQPMGYGYLTDETNLRLERVDPRRGYAE